MTQYVQTNEAGYVVGLTNEPLLTGLFGGSPRNFRRVEDEEADTIRQVLDAKHRAGEGLHINALEIAEE